MLTTVSFALEIKFVLKIDSIAWEIRRRMGNWEIRRRILFLPTQEVGRNTRLRLVFLPTFISCFNLESLIKDLRLSTSRVSPFISFVL